LLAGFIFARGTQADMSSDGEDKYRQITTLREELSNLKKQLKDLFIGKNSLNEQLNQLHKEIVGRISKISELKR